MGPETADERRVEEVAVVLGAVVDASSAAQRSLALALLGEVYIVVSGEVASAASTLDGAAARYVRDTQSVTALYTVEADS